MTVLFVVALLIILPPTGVFAAVGLESFTAQGTTTGILVTWRTATELHNLGFRLLRSTSSNGAYEDKGVFTSRCPGCIVGQTYTYADSAVTRGQTYFYKLQAVDTGRQFGPTSATVGVQSAVPTNTRATVSTATRTATAVPVVVKTSTRTPVSPTRTATLVASRTPTVKPVGNVTPPKGPITKVARAVATVPGMPATAVAGSLLAKTPMPALDAVAQVVGTPDDYLDQEMLADPNADESDSELPGENEREASIHRLINLATMGVVGLLGIASAVFAGIGAYLLARVTLRS